MLERRVSHLRQGGEGFVHVDLDHHAPFESGQVSPYGPHVMAKVILGGTLPVDPLHGTRQRLAGGLCQAVSPLECCLGIMPGRGQENRLLADFPSHDDLPGLAEAVVVTGDGRDPIDVQLRGQDSDDGPFLLQGCCNEGGNLVARRIEIEIRDLRCE